LVGGFAIYVACSGTAWQFTLPGMFLLGGALGLGMAHLRQLLATFGIDPSRPLVEVQQQCLRVHVLDLRTVWTVALLAPLTWPALLVVGLDLLGVDAYAALPTAWLWANLLLGVLWVPLLQILGRRLALWSRAPARLRAMAELATGSQLQAAHQESSRWRE
ncbi:MAG: hypothetical protein JNK49_18115, partial [Planctomycetes bacterium]|nr:hypothetical protein [Planctomycetota bacterium]